MAEKILPERLVGERIGGRFVIDRLIGDGPLSSAFRARDELLQRRVTVKLFHPQHGDDVSVVASQLELAKAVARLSHPNIVTVIDRGEHEGMPFIVLEYVRGENLQERIDRYAPLRIAEVVGYGMSIARALAYAHAQGVAHGNLRPVNVLISEDREVKLVDFGGGSYLASLTGLDPYLAPEVRSFEGVVEPEAGHDMFALGVLLFVALTEQHPAADTDASRVQMLRPDVSPRLANIIARAMAPDPDARYGSMHDLAADLAAVRLPGDHSGNGMAAGATSLIGQPTQAFQVAPADPGPGEQYDELAPEHDGDSGAAPVTRHERRPKRRQSRSRIFAWSMVLVPLIALLLVGAMIAGERGNLGRYADPDELGRNGEPAPIAVAEAQAWDPDGTGGEFDDEASRAIDGDEATFWRTESYDVKELSMLGGGKTGVGLILTLDEPADVHELTVITELNGWTATIYGADNVAGLTGIGDWGDPISQPTPVETGVPIEVDTGGHAFRSYLIWITTLSLEDRHRAKINEVELLAVT